jgi:hypothetical protein
MATLTAANAVIIFQVPTLFPTSHQLQGFSTDDVFSTDPIEVSQAIMGVDGILSGGFVFNPIKQNYTLQADSRSIDFFDAWYGGNVAARDSFACNGTIIYPGLGKKYSMVKGFLTNYAPIPAAKKMVQPQAFSIVWEQALASVA